MRPELAPHFIYNIESNYELGPGDENAFNEFEEEEQRQTFAIMANIDFKNLEKQTPGIQIDDIIQKRPSLGSNNQTSSCGTDGGPGMRFTFDEKDLDNDRVRCNKPITLNKNVSNFGMLIDKSASYWVNKGSKDESNKYAERTNRNVPMTNVIRKNRLICTKLEYAACMTIAKNFKAFKFRNDLQKRIMKKRIAIFHRK